MLKATPGPWAVNPLRARVDCGVLSEKGGLLPVAEMLWPTSERSEDETEANANLIAAAPDLYEALRELRWCGNDMRHRKQARAKADAALTKARGEQS